jgi:esterase/lipase superfamily enzyme
LAKVWRQILAAAALAILAGGCSIDDSGIVNSVWRPADGATLHQNVVFLTDRAPDEKAAGGFGTVWADKTTCGVAEAVIPPARLPGEPVQWGYVAHNPAPQQCAADGKMFGRVLALVEEQAKERHCNAVFLFVHGFQTGFDGAVLRAAQVSHDAQTGCAVLTFDWTATDDLGKYVADIERSEYSLPLLSELLRELSESGLHVTILAHSMGNRLVLAALSGFAHSRFAMKESFIDEMVLAAADIGVEKSNDDFRLLMNDAAPYVKRTTIYASSLDSVLAVSKDAHGGVPRLGREPRRDFAYQADDKTHIVDVIDASDVPADVFDHSYYAMSYEAVADMTLALKGVPMSERLKALRQWQPTLVCADKDDCGDGRTALATKRHPRFITRILINLAPLIPYVR